MLGGGFLPSKVWLQLLSGNLKICRQWKSRVVKNSNLSLKYISDLLRVLGTGFRQYIVKPNKFGDLKDDWVYKYSSYIF